MLTYLYLANMSIALHHNLMTIAYFLSIQSGINAPNAKPSATAPFTTPLATGSLGEVNI